MTVEWNSGCFMKGDTVGNAIGAMYEDNEPYEDLDETAEMIRREHINHEASVMSVGVLYYFGAVIGLVISCFAFATGISEGRVETILWSSFLIVLCVAQGVTAWGLRRLLGWARIPTIVISGIGLLGFPLGTLVNGYIIYLVACQKGAMVFSEPYKAVMEATPHIVYKTSKVVWVILIGFVAIIFLIGLFAALSA